MVRCIWDPRTSKYKICGNYSHKKEMPKSKLTPKIYARKLQEFCHKGGYETPIYKMIEGNLKTGKHHFVWEVLVYDRGSGKQTVLLCRETSGIHKSCRAARNEAAKKAFEKITNINTQPLIDNILRRKRRVSFNNKNVCIIMIDGIQYKDFTSQAFDEFVFSKNIKFYTYTNTNNTVVKLGSYVTTFYDKPEMIAAHMLIDIVRMENKLAKGEHPLIFVVSSMYEMFHLYRNENICIQYVRSGLPKDIFTKTPFFDVED